MPWRVSLPLTADSAIAIPQHPNLQGTGPGHKALQSDRIIILGFFYSYVAGAASVGFDLVQRDFAVSPGGTNNLVVYGDRSSAAGQVSLCVPECYIPLSRGVFTTPAASTFVRSAELHLDVTATAPSSGQIVLWGVITDGDEPVGKASYGSPLLTPYVGGAPNTTPDYGNVAPPHSAPFNQ
jgi:hypothetical protein